MQLLDKVVAFKSTAEDFSKVNPIISFYLYKYYLATAISFYKDTQDYGQKSQLEQEIKSIESQMNKMKSAAGKNLDEATDISSILEYVELSFAKNDHYHREGQNTQEVAQDFLTIFRLYEVVNRFGKLDEGQNKRRLYSKKKYIDIMKQIKAAKSLGQSQPKQSQIKPQQQQYVPPPPQANLSVQQINKSILKSGFKPQLPKPTQKILYDKITMQMQATKCLEYAVSELSFDRYKFAREQALRALQLLDQLIDQ